MFKQSQPFLDTQDSAHGIINHRFVHQSFAHRICEMIAVNIGAHINIQAGNCGLSSGIRIVCCNSVNHTFANCIRIADNQSVKLIFSLEDLTQGILIDGARNTIQIIK